MSEQLSVDIIRIDGGTQPRIEIDESTVSDYAEVVDYLPPVTVIHDGSVYWLADGFHRWHAHRLAGRSKISADVRPGSRRDAILFSVGANSSHGLRRSNADKRRAVETLLRDDEWATWSDSKIAELCVVSDKTVASVRRSIFGNPKIDPPRTVERGGTVYQQNTENIGKTRAKGDVSPTEAVKQISPPKPSTEQSAPEPDEYDGAPDEDEIQAALAADAADRRTLDMLLAADDKLAAAHSEIKRLNAEVAVLKGQRNQFQNEAAEWKRRAKRAEREAERAGRAKGA